MPDTIARFTLIGAIEKALSDSDIEGSAAEQLRHVGKSAERVAWGTFRAFDANGVKYLCPLSQTDLCKPLMDNTAVRLGPNARTFYRSFDASLSAIGLESVALEVVD